MTVFISPPLFFRSSRARLNWKPFLLTFGRWNFRCSTGLNSTCRDHRHNNHDYLRLWCASAGSADHWESAGLAPQGHDLQVWTKLAHRYAIFLLKYSIGWRPKKDSIEKRPDWEKTRLRKDKIEKRPDWEKTRLRKDKIEKRQDWEKTRLRKDQIEKR